MNKWFWLSWFQDEGFGPFTLHSPWWVSGHRITADLETEEIRSKTPTIVAAVAASDEAGAKELIMRSFDKRPVVVVWRFCEERPPEKLPFSDRFPRADWMQWPA